MTFRSRTEPRKESQYFMTCNREGILTALPHSAFLFLLLFYSLPRTNHLFLFFFFFDASVSICVCPILALSAVKSFSIFYIFTAASVYPQPSLLSCLQVLVSVSTQTCFSLSTFPCLLTLNSNKNEKFFFQYRDIASLKIILIVVIMMNL